MDNLFFYSTGECFIGSSSTGSEDDQEVFRGYKKKKKINKGRWTKEEDENLKAVVDEKGTRNWKVIASYFSDRTDMQCLHRWQKVLNPELVKGPWTKEEDEKVTELVKKYGPKKWSLIASFLKGRIGKQCRERWHNHLNPRIKKCAWTEDEDRLIYDAHAKLGNKWAEIAKLLPGRTDNAIKNHWNSTMRRKVESNGYEHYKENRYRQKQKNSARKEKPRSSQDDDRPTMVQYPQYLHTQLASMPTQVAIPPGMYSDEGTTTVVDHGHARDNFNPTMIKNKNNHDLQCTGLGSAAVNLSPLRAIPNFPDSLLETDPATWGDVSTFEGVRSPVMSKLASPGATGYRFSGHSLAEIQAGGSGSLIPMTSPVIHRFSTPPNILRKGGKKKKTDQSTDESSSTTAGLSLSPFSPRGTPIKLLPFSPSQFLNSPVSKRGKVMMTSTPASKEQIYTSNTTLNTPKTQESSDDLFQTPRIARHPLAMSPRTPTPFKTAIENLGKSGLTPTHFDEDLNDLIKKEEEESGMKIVKEYEMTPIRKNAPSQEKYGFDISPAGLCKELFKSTENENPNSSTKPKMIHSNDILLRSSIRQSPDQPSSVQPEQVFGYKHQFVTPSTNPALISSPSAAEHHASAIEKEDFAYPENLKTSKRKAHPIRNLRFQETPSKQTSKLDASWEDIACGKTPDQQIVTEQARSFVANSRPTARSLQFMAN